MPIDPEQFRKTLAQFVSGVTVVTCESGGTRHGITVSAFCSLSLDPPLILVCIEKRVTAHDAIASAGHFAVNVLAEDQEEISARFASRVEDRFEDVPVRPGSLGDPLIEGALATIECRVHEQWPGGDHTIFIGEIIASDLGEDDPLLYFRGDYRRLAE